MTTVTKDGITSEYNSYDILLEIIDDIKNHYIQQSFIGYKHFPLSIPHLFKEQIINLFSNCSNEDEKVWMLNSLLDLSTTSLQRLTVAYDELYKKEDGERDIDKVKKEYSVLIPLMNKQWSFDF